MRAVIFIHFLYLILINTFTVKGALKCDSKVELRAVLLSCPTRDSGCDEDDPLSQSMRSEDVQILQTDPSSCEKIKQEKAKEFPSAVKDCKRKLVITLKVKSSGKIPCDDEYIVVDHVFDPLTGGRGRLLSPVVIKLRQEQMIQLYRLQFQRVVNSDPFEEHKPSSAGCSVDPKNPSCGIVMYNGKPIPFSEGFCCSCDPHLNAKRQLSPLSLGEGFPPHGDKLHQEDGQAPVENKANVIYNPELVMLKSGIPREGTAAKENDMNDFFDSIFAEKIPNFLLAGDRKIVCDKGDFMKELSHLRDDTKEASGKNNLRMSDAAKDLADRESDATENGGVSAFPSEAQVTTDATGAIDPKRLTGLEKNALELQNIIKSLNLINPSEPPGTRGARGKRESRRKNKKLSLEEKLNRFATSKNWLATGRRKRLMEISHRRFQKSEDGRPLAEESGYGIETMKPSPPRYFFSHDRTIIDPLESLDPNANISCGFKDKLCEYPSKGKELASAKGPNCRPAQDKETSMETSFYQPPTNENKMVRKDSFADFKKGNGFGERGMLERGDRHLKKEEEEDGDEEGGELEEKGVGSYLEDDLEKGQTSQFHANTLKHFLYKTDREKLKLKHLFLSKGKEKSELGKNKFGEHGQFEDWENDRLAEQNPSLEGKIERDTKEPEISEGSWEVSTSQFGPMKFRTERRGASMLTDPVRKHQRGAPGRGHHPASPIGKVDFKIRIFRNKGQDMYEGKPAPTFSSDRTPVGYGKPQNPFLPYVSSQRRERLRKGADKYLFRSGNLLQNRPRYLKEPWSDLNGAMKDGSAFRHRKPSRGHSTQVDDNPDENTYKARWSDSLRDTHPRDKRHPEPEPPKVDKRESEPGQHCDDDRNKRSASYVFQPAKGFFESEFESPRKEGPFVHELETCGRRRSCPRVKHGNASSDAGPGVAKRNAKMPTDKERLMQSYLNAPDYILEEVEGMLKGKREMLENIKGKPPSNGPPFECADPQDTAHCMRFGDLWYSLYTIRKPTVSQIVGVQLFDKHTVGERTEWRDLTKGKMIRVGTFLTKAEDELPSLSVTYAGERTGRTKNTIDPDNYFLLIPTHVSEASKASYYPQIDGGPSEYLLVPTKEISSGGECNRIGTSFEAFARQPDRCARRRGSCLKRQPMDLWREDMEARIRGKRGKYFVENFGHVPNSPVKSYTNLTGEFLALEYYGEYTSTIEIEVKADSNAIIRKGCIAQIPLVYIDSTYPKKTRIILSIVNSGLTSSNFRPRLGDCPPSLDVAWCPLEGPLVTVPPNQRHDFKLDLSGALPQKEIHLRVQVLSQTNKDVASRRILIKRQHRCVCAFHCKCNCIGSPKDSKACHRLNADEYRKAGYLGTYPFRGGAANFAAGSGSTLKNLRTTCMTAAAILLVFGVVKGIVGLFVRRLGIAGLRVITGPRQLCAYYEPELKGCTVLFDDCGFPIHPTTCKPVQIVPLYMEIILNSLFFFLYPLRGIWFFLVTLSCCAAIYSDCDSCCRRDETGMDRRCSRPLLAKEPDPTFVHYNLTSTNSKRSKQDFLPYPGYRGDDDPLEEDDTEFVLQEMKRYRKK